MVSVHTGGSQGGGGDKPGVGLAAVLQRIGDEGRTVPTVMAELKWQREVNGETARTDAFREKMLSLLEFKAFAFMNKSGSPWVQLGHGLGKFYSLHGTVPELDGKVIMFIGDRGWTRDPTPVQAPVQNMWKWITVNVANDVAALQAFAQTNAGLWQPGGGNSGVAGYQGPIYPCSPECAGGVYCGERGAVSPK